jgi:uncharacterized HhH-GPD family protein
MTLSTTEVSNSASGIEHGFPSDLAFRHEPFVVGALLEFGRAIERRGVTQLAPDPDADHLVRLNPFAFLVGVILSQGIPAERAFTGPLLLEDRLGHLSPWRIVEDPNQLRDAMRTRPMPHRFPDKTSDWIVGAANRVVDRLGGHTDLLWTDTPTAAQLAIRLMAFDGIGQKKAAMTVEILARDLGVPIADLSGSDIAVDVHVRRVFTRTRLATDRLHEIVNAARRGHPSRPGALDIPAWVVGRTWCRPQNPLCEDCPIGWACPSASVVGSVFPEPTVAGRS